MSDITKLIDGLDERKAKEKAKTKRSQFTTPGPMATEIMLLNMETPKGDASLAKSHLNAIKGLLKKD